MTLSNELQTYLSDEPCLETHSEIIDKMLLMLSPMAPHFAHELWEMRGHDTLLALESWPTWDPELAREESVTLIVQVNGKVRDRIEVLADIDDSGAEEVARASMNVQRWLIDRDVKRVIVRAPNLVNIVVE
jgi:leucyl-tRNA synthetase